MKRKMRAATRSARRARKVSPRRALHWSSLRFWAAGLGSRRCGPGGSYIVRVVAAVGRSASRNCTAPRPLRARPYPAERAVRPAARAAGRPAGRRRCLGDAIHYPPMSQPVPAGSPPAGSGPNVLFILSDDQGPWAAGCYGNPEIRTPNLDRLAATGVRFERFFVATPVCSPSRATYLTGLIPSQHGIHDWLYSGHSRPELKNYNMGPDARPLLGGPGGLDGRPGSARLPLRHQRQMAPGGQPAPAARDGLLVRAPARGRALQRRPDGARRAGGDRARLRHGRDHGGGPALPGRARRDAPGAALRPQRALHRAPLPLGRGTPRTWSTPTPTAPSSPAPRSPAIPGRAP